MIKSLDLEMTAEGLLKNISISQVNETEIIKINVEDENPALSRNIADVFLPKKL